MRDIGGCLASRWRRGQRGLASAAALLLLAAIAAAAGAGGFLARRALRLNLSSSLPLGLYRVVDGVPMRGSIVVVCPPGATAALARARGYVIRGGCPGGVAPLGKIVIGIEGDTIALDAAGVVANGARVPMSEPRALDRRGRPLTHYPYFVRTLRPGELWLFAPHPSSFDSRYFGPVTRSAVRARLVPVWTIAPLPATYPIPAEAPKKHTLHQRDATLQNAERDIGDRR